MGQPAATDFITPDAFHESEQFPLILSRIRKIQNVSSLSSPQAGRISYWRAPTYTVICSHAMQVNVAALVALPASVPLGNAVANKHALVMPSQAYLPPSFDSRFPD
ncbi:predicted protein [Histoplasma mississippiense (nom. inval.)]|uniref:predicted protein n=1 Tax=Ajellomyces capsulatus (strain NAm1 / WU24) TaxID=2059318 RepID=UPI000157D2D2|nr:predicted protein [Histoplasma mississippiense (nom. inval.)]EDN04442.1 predicted protein [Histoplasma mississippiense (nom. inval.)]